MRLMKMLVASIALCFAFAGARGQGRDAVMGAMKALSEHYRGFASLSFDVAYRYATEESPGNCLDSLKGSFKMSGDAYWYSIDNTESAGNKDYLVMLFKEDKLMYITKPSPIVSTANPAALIDSFLSGKGQTGHSLSESGGEQEIAIFFAPGLSYKKIQYWVSKKTGLLVRMAYTIDSKKLNGAYARNEAGSGPIYAVVEATFSNYRTGGFGKGDLDIGKYFSKEGGEYRVAPAYSAYKIFLGSINL